MRCSDLARTASLSGLALLCGGAASAPQLVPNDQATTLRPSRMASVDYIDGRYVRTSAWIDCSAPASAKGVLPVRVAYDASGLSFEDNDFDGLPDGAVCGDICAAAIGGTASTRWAFPELGSSIVDDFNVSDGSFSSASSVDGFNAMVSLSHSGCDRLYTLFALWSSMDGTGAGYDTDGDGTADDAIDRGPSGSAAFLGGVVTEWTTTTCPDTDMDGIPNGASGGGAGYAVLDTGFNTGSGWIANNIGIPLTDSGFGGIEFILASDYIDTDADGVDDSVVPRTGAFPMLWGTDEEQLSFDGATLLPGSPGCTGRLGLSSSAIWGSNTPGFTPDEFFALEDPTMTSCPNPFSAAIAFYATESVTCSGCGDCNGNGINDADDIASGTSQDANFDGLPDECPAGRNRFCSDVNANGVHAEPADFVAWLALFNDPGDELAYRADVNNNGRIQEPSDFVQWLSYFNAPATVPGDCLD